MNSSHNLLYSLSFYSKTVSSLLGSSENKAHKYILSLSPLNISRRFCTLSKTMSTFCHLRKCSLVRQLGFSQTRGMYDALLTANTEASGPSVCSYRGSVFSALYLTPTQITCRTFIASNESLLQSIAEMWL